jgi:hypothetical protein
LIELAPEQKNPIKNMECGWFNFEDIWGKNYQISQEARLWLYMHFEYVRDTNNLESGAAKFLSSKIPTHYLNAIL